MVTKLEKHGARARGICCINGASLDSKKQKLGERQDMEGKGGNHRTFTSTGDIREPSRPVYMLSTRTWVQALVQEDPTCCRAAKPMCFNYGSCALEPVSHNY